MAKRRRRQDEKKRHKGERHARREYLNRDRDNDLDGNKSMKKSYHTSRASGTHGTDSAVVIVAIVCIIAVMGGSFLYLNYDTIFDPGSDSDDEPIDLDDNMDIIPNPNDKPDNNNNNIPPFTPSNPANSIVIMEIKDYGVIVIELYENKDVGITVENFLQYVRTGYYDDTIFHRVMDGFMIQGGGFTAGADSSNPVAKALPPGMSQIPLEIDNSLKHVDGAIAMARQTEPDTATSQFFIDDGPQSGLEPNANSDGYAVFGQVVAGMEIVREISAVNVHQYGGHEAVPDTPVEILRAYEYTGPIVS